MSADHVIGARDNSTFQMVVMPPPTPIFILTSAMINRYGLKWMQKKNSRDAGLEYIILALFLGVRSSSCLGLACAGCWLDHHSLHRLSDLPSPASQPLAHWSWWTFCVLPQRSYFHQSPLDQPRLRPAERNDLHTLQNHKTAESKRKIMKDHLLAIDIQVFDMPKFD